MRTRFPPSPTGLLHVGGLRTALYNYLIAKQSKSAFVMRVEDTDRERTVEGAVEDFLDVMNCCGIAPDEGVVLKDGKVTESGNHGPYIQSQRTEIYREHAEKLVESGALYYAFDTKEEIERMREEMKSDNNPSPKYDAAARVKMKNSLTLSEDEVKTRIDNGDEYVLRLQIDPNRTIEVEDEIRGKMKFMGHTLDDPILMKSDGYPTYHLANVVDDHLMEVELVMRGEEWLPSLPKHVLLYEAFGWNPPKFAHLPLLLNPGGGKLSKRQGDVAVRDYIDKGYLPEAVLNFLAFLGWNPGTEEELFTLEEMVKEFKFEKIQKAGAVFDVAKLDWYQGQWMRKFSLEEFCDRIQPIVADKYKDAATDKDFAAKAELIQDRITFLHEAPEMLSFFYEEPKFDMEIVANKKQKVTAEMVPEVITMLTETLESIDESKWDHDTLKDALFALAEAKDLKTGQVLWPLRAILTGLPFSPGAFEVAAVLGKEKTMQRLAKIE